MPHDDSVFALYDNDLAEVWQNNPVAHAARRAAFYAKVDELTTLRTVILQMHRAYEMQQKMLFDAMDKAKTFDLMTEGITLKDGRHFVFRPPIA